MPALYKRDSEIKDQYLHHRLKVSNHQQPYGIIREGAGWNFECVKWSARSRADGEEKLGHLETLKYEYKGMLCQAEVKEDKLRIPLDASPLPEKNKEQNQRRDSSNLVTCTM